MLRSLILITTLMFGSLSWAEPTAEQPDRNAKEYNLDGQTGLKGFDPVAYFEEFGGQALEGDPSISATYGGVTYNFVSEENKQAFLQDPTRFEPTYGGWCAWGAANGARININPMLFTQNGNRMHFFLNVRTKRRFDADLVQREIDADEFWMEYSGEAPRL